MRPVMHHAMNHRDRHFVVCARGLLACAMTLACLPTDTRPPPATVNVTVSGSNLVKNGIPGSAMEDGWSVSFERFLASVGNASLGGDACVPYSEADYRRIFDLRTVEPQKLSVLYALATCDFRFRVNNADTDSILGAGVTEEDKTLMRTPGSDPYSGTQPTGVSIYVKGSATKGSITKKFAWSFRPRRLEFRDCRAAPGLPPMRLSLTSSESVTLDVQLHGEVLFQDRLDTAKAKLRFAPFAAADDKYGNGDGEITLEELGKVSLDDAGITPDDLTQNDAGVMSDGDAGIAAFKTFEDFVYLGLFPQLARLGPNGTCNSSVGRPRGG